MNGKISGLVKAAASVSLAGGILMAAAGPAAAASPNEAYGAEATGVVSLPPVAEATHPGVSPVTLATVNLGALLRAEISRDTADATSASSTLVDIQSVLLDLHARAVTSACSFDPNTGLVTGGASIVSGHVGLIALSLHPARNTTITVPGVATIVLNRQIRGTDGTLTVDAIYVSLLGRAQTVTLAASVCNAASTDPVPVLPGMALPIGLGGLTVLMLGGLGYQFSRRRRQAAAAA